ncbi:MAG TPA: HNH endonuclease signature motif containing protein [Dehalococcoidia bacterium]|nr:HNH endonuclease signature motif containing protein [Dehalococcoidia bacterium]
MPFRVASPCMEPGCPALAVARGRCAGHQRAAPLRASSAQRGYGAEWRRLRAAFLAAHPLCCDCGEPATDVDHETPRSAGGTDDWRNLRSRCHRCHSKKTAARDGGFGNRGKGGSNL